MRHQRVKEFLLGYAAGALFGKRRRAVEVHLESCADCRKERDRLQGLVNDLKEKKETFTVSEPVFQSAKAAMQERYRENFSGAGDTKKSSALVRWFKGLFDEVRNGSRIRWMFQPAVLVPVIFLLSLLVYIVSLAANPEPLTALNLPFSLFRGINLS